MSQASVLYTTGIMLSCPACDYPVDNLPLYAGYWPVLLVGDTLTPPFALTAGAATAAPKHTPPPQRQ